MDKVITSFFGCLLVLLCCYFCEYSLGFYVVSLIGCFLLFDVGFHIRGLFVKAEDFSLKSEFIFLVLITLLHLGILLWFDFSFFAYVSYFMSVYGVYLYARRLVGKKCAFMCSVIGLFVMPFVYGYVFLPLCLLMFYVVNNLDMVSFWRLKNVVKLLVLFGLSILSVFANPLCLVCLLIIMYKLFRASFKNMLIVFVPFLVCLFFLLKVFPFSFSLFSSYPLWFLFSLVGLVIFSFHNGSFGFCLSSFLAILFCFFMNVSIGYLAFIVPLCLVMYGTLIFNKLDYRLHFKFFKYFKARDVKKVSVVIPNYNYASYLPMRVDCILKQNYPIYELIILDDCSSDNSVDVILDIEKMVKKNYPHIKFKFIKNKRNSGNVFKQWLKAFDVSSGDYLWICEADDLCSHYFLRAVMKGFSDPLVVISYAESKAIDENGKVFKKNLRDWIDVFSCGHWNNGYINDGVDELKEVLGINNTIANVSSVVFNKRKDISFGKFLKEAMAYRLAGDWYFYSKVLLFGKISYCDEALNYHRMHKNSVTSSTSSFTHYKEIVSVQDSIYADVSYDNLMRDLVLCRRENEKSRLMISDEELYYENVSLSDLTCMRNVNDEVLLSIIIPVYNVSAYLDRCLNSVLTSLPLKSEVIIINDGSTDGSEKIICRYLKKYDNIVYIKKENGGLSSVKNLGLSKARGRYVGFVDSDDYVSFNMFDVMLKVAIDGGYDIVYSDVLMVYDDGSIRYCSMENYLDDDPLVRVLDNPLMAASWNKLVRRDLYDGLSFPVNYNNEDVAISPVLFVRSKSMFHVVSPFYKYVQRSGSIQNSGFSEKRFDIFDTVKICKENVKGCSKDVRMKVMGNVVTHQLLGLLFFTIGKLNNRDYVWLFCERFNELGSFDDNYYVRKYLEQHKAISLLEMIRNYDVDKIMKLIR